MEFHRTATAKSIQATPSVARQRRPSAVRTNSSISSGSCSSQSSRTTVRRVTQVSKVKEPAIADLFDNFDVTIDEARNAAQTLQKLVLLKAPTDIVENEVVKDYSHRCQMYARKIDAMMNHSALNVRKSKQILYDTYNKLENAITRHQNAVLDALQAMGVSREQIQAAIDQQQKIDISQAVATHESTSHSTDSKQPLGTREIQNSEPYTLSDSSSDSSSSSDDSGTDGLEIVGLRRHVLRLMFLTRLDRVPQADESGNTSGVTTPARARAPSDTASQRASYNSPRVPTPTARPQSMHLRSIGRSFSAPSLLQYPFTTPPTMLESPSSFRHRQASTDSVHSRPISSGSSSTSKASSASDGFSDKSSETSESSSTSEIIDLKTEIQELRQQVALLGQRLELPSAAQRAESALNRLLWKRLVDIDDDSVRPNGELRQFADMMIPDMMAEASTPTVATPQPMIMPYETNMYGTVDWKMAGLGPHQLGAVKGQKRPGFNQRMDSGYCSSIGSGGPHDNYFDPRIPSVILE